jgi:hypothetical protein
MPPYRFEVSKTMTSEQIDAEYEKAFLEKKKISIEKSRIDPKDEESIRIKRITELKWERKCNWLLEDLDKKLVEERPAREMRELLLRLKTTGEGGIQIANALPDVGTYTGGMLGGKRHGQGIMLYENTDKYDGRWENDKMNGMGTFTKNVRSTGTYDWEFLGEFKDNYPLYGQLIQSEYGSSEQKTGNPNITIFDWNPHETNQQVAGGQVSAAGAADLRRKIQDDVDARMTEKTTRTVEETMLSEQKAREDRKAREELQHKKGF